MKKNYRAYTLMNYRSIPQISRLSAGQREAIEVVGRVLPFKTNNYVTEELIDWRNVEHDPIYTLNFPRQEMLERKYYRQVHTLLKAGQGERLSEVVRSIRLGLNPNPAGQEYNVPVLENVRLKGIQHKYRETVLFFPAHGQTCHAYCSFCFRWPQFTGMTEFRFAMKETEWLVKYLKLHPQVTDVLFTGGDPMTMPASLLKVYIEPLLQPELEHVCTIRIGTKSLAYWPYRYLADEDAPEVLRLFERIVAAGRNLTIQAHFNHPVELSTPAAEQAIRQIRCTGAQIRTQSPLLKHINDRADLWAAMWRRQVDLSCIPYYMFVARDTGARHYFEMPLEKCWEIFRKAYAQVSGTCRTVRGPSMSASPGKIQILGVAEMKGEKVFVLRFIQGRCSQWVDLPFFAAYDPKATWFSDLKPAFGEKDFFFERDVPSFPAI